VLVHRAGAIRPPGLVGNWLYGVAQRTAQKARSTNARRSAKEHQAASRGSGSSPETGNPMAEVLDRELNALPTHYRAALVLCDLEGLTIEEAARRLGCPPGTIGTRLIRGRKLLSRRLARYGPGALGGAVATVTASAAGASVPALLLKSTIHLGCSVVRGQAGCAGLLSPGVAALTEGMIKAMARNKMKHLVAVFLLVVLACWAGFALRGALAAPVPAAPSGEVLVRDEPAAKPVAFRPREEVAGLKAVALTADGKTAAVGGVGGKVIVWDVPTGRKVQVIQVQGTVHALGFVGATRSLVVGTEAEFDGRVELWSSNGGAYKLAQTLDAVSLPGLKGGGLHGLAVSPDGKELALASNTGWTYLYDLPSWTPTGVLFERSNLTSSLMFSPDGKALATAGNTFSVWSVDKTSPLRKPRAQREVAEIEAASKASLRWFSRAAGEAFRDPYCSDMAFSPDGTRVAGTTGVSRLDSGGNLVRVWEASSGKLLWVGQSKEMLCVIFSADGKAVVTGSGDGFLRVWDAGTGKLTAMWQGHDKAVRQLVPVREGTFLSVGEDGKAILWEADGKRIRHLGGE
jgi:hypothetical protein